MKKTEVNIRSNSLTIKTLQLHDEAYLLEWLTNDEVLQYYEGRDCEFTLEKIRQKFYNREKMFRCLVYFNNAPIGYVQFYPLSNVGWLSVPAQTYGMDQFIGEPAYWNKGIGEQLVSTVVDYLTEVKGASLVVMDPQLSNKRAIACYEKVGFEKKYILEQHEWHEGALRDCQLMLKDSESNLLPIRDEVRDKIKELFTRNWGSAEMVISSGVYHCDELEGFYMINKEGVIEGVVTYIVRDRECEIISLDSFKDGRGIGSRLVMEVEIAAFKQGITTITLITTNDNLDALRFYQKRGYRITEVMNGALDEARKIKPTIPDRGYYGIQLLDELVLTKVLCK